MLDNCEKSQDEMVKIEEDDNVEIFPISTLPKKAAILIDKYTASSAETLVRFGCIILHVSRHSFFRMTPMLVRV